MKTVDYLINVIKKRRNRLVVSFLLSGLAISLCAFFDCSLKFGILISFIYLFIALMRFDNDKIGKLFFILYSLLFPFVILFLSQLLLNENVFMLEIHKILLGFLCVFCVIMFINLLLSNYKKSAVLGSLILMILTTANHFVYAFRGNELAPHDFLAIGTAMNVVGNYDFQVTAPLLYSWQIYIAVLYSFSCFTNKEKNVWKRLSTSGMFVLSLICFMVFSNSVVPLHFLNTGSASIGYILNFTLQLKETFVSKPSNYSFKGIEELENVYSSYFEKDNPNYVVIMNESFAKLDAISLKDEFSEVAPYYDSLIDNSIKGYTLSSIFGVRTPNSEYEFLTGNTMAFLPNGAIVYQQYLKNFSYSLVEHMNSLNYNCIAVHPYLANGWMRPTVYQNLNFDEKYFIDDFKQEKLIRDFVSDQEMYEWIIDKYESSTKEKQFIFGVTMQNHGGYDYEGYESTVKLEGYSKEYPDVEQYLSLIQESDKALEYLIGYFETVNEPVVIVFFGDHFPALDQEFYEEVHGGAFDTLEEQMLQYKVPFFIWANYDIEEKYIECTSLNYLSNYMFEAAGMELPAYNKFLKNVEEVIPAINALGFYSKADECFKTFEEANEEEKYWLNLYEQLQYNCLFDKENRSEVFFPIPDGE